MSVWSKKEKLRLLTGLYKYGPDDVKNLKKMVSTKHEYDIRKRVNLYKRLANKEYVKEDTEEHMSVPKRKTSRYLVWPNDSLANKWACVVSHWCNVNSPPMDLSEALRIIAHLENHPNPDECSTVDLKHLYLYLADIVEGKLPVQINAMSRELLITTLLNLTLKVKQSSNRSEVNFVENITRIFPNVTKSETETTATAQALNQLLSSVDYNPLAIPENLLNKGENIENC